ncbi:hypothetical protein P9112_003445 [Eukaryota sp. TZLM1-RC]
MVFYIPLSPKDLLDPKNECYLDDAFDPSHIDLDIATLLEEPLAAITDQFANIEHPSVFATLFSLVHHWEATSALPFHTMITSSLTTALSSLSSDLQNPCNPIHQRSSDEKAHLPTIVNMYVCLTCWLITNQLSFVRNTKKSAVAKQSQGDEEAKGEKENHERSYLSLLQALCSLLNSPQLTRVFTDNSDLNSFFRILLPALYLCEKTFGARKNTEKQIRVNLSELMVKISLAAARDSQQSLSVLVNTIIEEIRITPRCDLLVHLLRKAETNDEFYKLRIIGDLLLENLVTILSDYKGQDGTNFGKFLNILASEAPNIVLKKLIHVKELASCNNSAIRAGSASMLGTLLLHEAHNIGINDDVKAQNDDVSNEDEEEQLPIDLDDLSVDPNQSAQNNDLSSGQNQPTSNDSRPQASHLDKQNVLDLLLDLAQDENANCRVESVKILTDISTNFFQSIVRMLPVVTSSHSANAFDNNEDLVILLNDYEPLVDYLYDIVYVVKERVLDRSARVRKSSVKYFEMLLGVENPYLLYTTMSKLLTELNTSSVLNEGISDDLLSEFPVAEVLYNCLLKTREIFEIFDYVAGLCLNYLTHYGTDFDLECALKYLEQMHLVSLIQGSYAVSLLKLLQLNDQHQREKVMDTICNHFLANAFNLQFNDISDVEKTISAFAHFLVNCRAFYLNNFSLVKDLTKFLMRKAPNLFSEETIARLKNYVIKMPALDDVSVRLDTAVGSIIILSFLHVIGSETGLTLDDCVKFLSYKGAYKILIEQDPEYFHLYLNSIFSIICHERSNNVENTHEIFNCLFKILVSSQVSDWFSTSERVISVIFSIAQNPLFVIFNDFGRFTDFCTKKQTLIPGIHNELAIFWFLGCICSSFTKYSDIEIARIQNEQAGSNSSSEEITRSIFDQRIDHLNHISENCLIQNSFITLHVQFLINCFPNIVFSPSVNPDIKSILIRSFFRVLLPSRSFCSEHIELVELCFDHSFSYRATSTLLISFSDLVVRHPTIVDSVSGKFFGLILSSDIEIALVALDCIAELTLQELLKPRYHFVYLALALIKEDRKFKVVNLLKNLATKEKYLYNLMTNTLGLLLTCVDEVSAALQASEEINEFHDENFALVQQELSQNIITESDFSKIITELAKFFTTKVSEKDSISIKFISKLKSSRNGTLSKLYLNIAEIFGMSGVSSQKTLLKLLPDLNLDLLDESSINAFSKIITKGRKVTQLKAKEQDQSIWDQIESKLSALANQGGVNDSDDEHSKNPSKKPSKVSKKSKTKVVEEESGDELTDELLESGEVEEEEEEDISESEMSGSEMEN